MNKEYYVYGAYGIHGELLYIGYGKGDRHKHCNNGMSSNKGLNRYYFLNGEGDCIKVEKLFENLSIDDATHLETLCINHLSPSCNVRGTVRDFQTVAKEYYDAYLISDNDKMQSLIDESLDFSEILNIIGIEPIKATSFHKTKCKDKCDKIINAVKYEQKKRESLKAIKLKTGDFYNYAELKIMVKTAYEKFNIPLTAKATDIKQAFNVKRTRRNGVEGFIIGEKL